jgi:hypothetical protein
VILILVTGPNASGKTTSVKAALTPWVDDPRVATVYADNGSGWKLKPAEMMAKLIDLCDTGVPVIVVEGTNRIASAVLDIKRQIGARTLIVHATRASAEDMKASIRRRCEGNGKEFKAEYWTTKMCEYEGRGRYRNLIGKHGVTATWWQMDLEFSYAPAFIAMLRKQVEEELAKS